MSRLVEGPTGSGLAADVVRGFGAIPRWLPPKHFYDRRGALLFDAICDTPEYYPTRTEQALLEQVADSIIALAQPTALVELGSGAARKTRILLDALGRATAAPCYVPVDISEHMLIESALALLDEYPRLRIQGVVADYDYHLHLLPESPRRLIAFLGGSIGNFRQPGAVRFLRRLASGMKAGDAFLLGLDLVKEPRVLHAAYNDAAGVTAEFNRNVLRVINRELDADFEPSEFDHEAGWVPEQEHIEMHLVSRRACRVSIPAIGRRYHFAAGERIRTEISRKFTAATARRLLEPGGLALAQWYESPDGYFALALAHRVS